jgi:hypothetical protein
MLINPCQDPEAWHVIYHVILRALTVSVLARMSYIVDLPGATCEGIEWSILREFSKCQLPSSSSLSTLLLFTRFLKHNKCLS